MTDRPFMAAPAFRLRFGVLKNDDGTFTPFCRVNDEDMRVGEPVKTRKEAERINKAAKEEIERIVHGHGGRTIVLKDEYDNPTRN